MIKGVKYVITYKGEKLYESSSIAGYRDWCNTHPEYTIVNMKTHETGSLVIKYVEVNK